MSKQKTGKGIGFTGLLTIAFIVLKLCSVIDWSWWWVLSPMWIWLLVVIFCTLLVVAIDVYEQAQNENVARKRRAMAHKIRATERSEEE